MNNQIIHLDTISELNKILGLETHHPLITVVDFSKISVQFDECLISTNLYSIMVKDSCQGIIKYGRNRYDYQEETMIFFGPRQIIGVEGTSNGDSKGLGIYFHPDILRGTPLASNIKSYNFFSYQVSEALHLSSEERRIIGDCTEKIEGEIARPIDKHSRRIIVSNIELLLGYCERFYDRQFITRESINHDILSKFESILEEYFNSDIACISGLPTVKYCAEKLNLSPNYFSDLIKRETGLSAQEHIQEQIIERAKIELTTSSRSVAEIAHSLGFEYPQYFSRQFKKRTGVTPNKYRTVT